MTRLYKLESALYRESLALKPTVFLIAACTFETLLWGWTRSRLVRTCLVSGIAGVWAAAIVYVNVFAPWGPLLSAGCIWANSTKGLFSLS